MRSQDREPVMATVGPVPELDRTPIPDTKPDAVPVPYVPKVIRNPLVAGDELWDAVRYLAPKVGIHVKRRDDVTTEPARPAFAFAPLFVEP